MKPPLEERLGRAAPPKVPPGLRQRTLAAAAAELTRTLPPSWIDLLYTSRTLRWSWATACALLVAAHLMIGSGRPETTLGGDLRAARQDAVIADAMAITARTAAEIVGTRGTRLDRDQLWQRLATDPAAGGLPL